VARYAQGQNSDEPLAESRSGTVDYYEQDGLGSVTSLTATNGTVAQTYTYDSFGNTVNSTGSVRNYFQYTGREFDTETGLYYYRARYYDQVSGRFLSEDPLRIRGRVNFYRYVRNNAPNRIDPSGLTPCPYDDCKITILRPGMQPADAFDWCADNGMKLIWVADCAGGKDCCIDKLSPIRSPARIKDINIISRSPFRYLPGGAAETTIDKYRQLDSGQIRWELENPS
jgi:RHS repeat-associated protein